MGWPADRLPCGECEVPRSAIRFTFTTLLFAGLLALGVFTILMWAQRSSNDAAATATIDPNAVVVGGEIPTSSPYRTEEIDVDGQRILLNILNSKDTLTEAQWQAQNQPAAAVVAVQATAAPVQEQPTVDPNLQIQPAPTTIIVPSPTFPPPQVTAQVAVPANVDKVIFKDYQVVQGDSLYSIADAQNSSIELMSKHGVDANDLVPGSIIRLPYANPAYCPGYRAYVVRDRDTAYRIAAWAGTTVTILAQLNRLDANYTVYVTDVICIP